MGKGVPLKRAEAIRLGRREYSAKPCRRCGYRFRTARTGKCPDCEHTKFFAPNGYPWGHARASAEPDHEMLKAREYRARDKARRAAAAKTGQSTTGSTNAPVSP
jgi:hypothetical protein